ncbi:transglycosylase SLT domain-containing protein [Variovorax dokdonensis]|uniref:Transglycosylase SLT domain-containing protein n=1 Tax=Variovorax dokdonensis TaxID=344883 RepID=A0ABT7NCL8_9BURK|nr:transglycosylase SLT domain-containing protein [Variovorax dokdonensis]MDM0045666.1 transglycosylase SLT domain-containing protein [Variovorax dokdonensis]
MKLLWAWLLATLFLAGCASQAPLFPDGPLKPISQTDIGAGKAHGVKSMTPPVDMWDRIRRGFAMPDLDNDLVHDREQWYATRPDYIQRMTERSNKYIFFIVEELERRNMPTELALLPYIESAFNPQAVSSARAMGMWQFMPATGSDYDLKQNIFRDDRRDVIASTRAALDYLQRLYDMFGDWQLALAAYNWGEGSVGRAIKKNQSAGLGTTYSDLNMPAETRMYVPKLQAVKNIVANPSKFGVDLPYISNHPYFTTVELTRDLDVDLAAKLADVRIEDFRALNPAAHKPVLLAAGTPNILLPWDNGVIFERNFKALTEGQYASWTAWTVPETMTAANAAQRAGMSETDLRAVNNIPPRMMIKAGSTLIVPRSARVKEDVAAVVADSGQLSFQPEVVTRRTSVRTRGNESVTSVARRYKLSPSSVAEWNDVPTNHVFKRGFNVVVYLPVRESSSQRVGSGARSTPTSKRSVAASHSKSKSSGSSSKRKR